MTVPATLHDRVIAGLKQARLLLADGQVQAAAAVPGDLDAFAAQNYGVAWTTLSLYRAGRQRDGRQRAQRVRSLQRRRNLAIELPIGVR